MFSIHRYWGTPIPLWMSEDGVETVCIGSIAELEELSGVKAERNGEKDLHRETIDKITIPSKRPGELFFEYSILEANKTGKRFYVKA